MQIISLKEARYLALLNQKLYHTHLPRTKNDLLKIIEQIGYVQIDTISIVERAHHHVLWTRFPGYQKSMLDELVKNKKVFEYWSHAAAYLPMRDFRFSLHRKNAYKEKYKDWAKKNRKILNYVYDRIKNEGALQSRDFEHPPRKSAGWWDWKPTKDALEFLFHSGELVIRERKNFQKVYDIPERVLTQKINTILPSEAEYSEHLIMKAINANGFVSEKEITYLRRHHQQTTKSVLNNLLESKKIIPLRIKEIEKENYYTTEKTLKSIDKILSKDVLHILSPFDNLIIQRKRLNTLFNFDYTIECYVPAPKRKYGYYVLPIFYKDKFIGRLDAKADRQKNSFRIINYFWEDTFKFTERFKKKFNKKLSALARFAGCENNENPL
ncbi:MAG TPA: crosslink repair DNA glycosylase YcaQ family protein [Ignavibacteria bacterium]|nr:crosslink repair DNA glycosylase YcaQ family protein [Ignavibacteria bacterium]